MKYRIFVTTLITLSLSLLACTDSQTVVPVSDQEAMKQGVYGKILVLAGVDWSIYSKIKVDRASVEFRENWVSDQESRNRYIITEKDQERIKSDMADLLHKVLTGELSGKGGYELTDQSGADVMHLVPRITKLDIYAPDRIRNQIGEVLVDSEGSMALALEVHDSLSGDLLAIAVKRQQDPEKGYMEITNSATFRTAARQMMQRWTDWLIEWLDAERTGALD